MKTQSLEPSNFVVESFDRSIAHSFEDPIGMIPHNFSQIVFGMAISSKLSVATTKLKYCSCFESIGCGCINASQGLFQHIRHHSILWSVCACFWESEDCPHPDFPYFEETTFEASWTDCVAMHQVNDMKVLEYDSSLWEMLLLPTSIGIGHIHGNDF